MTSKPSVVTRRVPTRSLMAFFLRHSSKARTTPAKLLRSAMPIVARPSASACATISAGWEAPRRKEKLVVTASSAYAVMDDTARFFYPFVPAQAYGECGVLIERAPAAFALVGV